jgi:signal recognition particle receptor subunit beta
MIVFLITFIDSINEKNQLNKTIIDELSITKQLINKIIQSNEEDIQSYNSQQKIIVQKAKQLEESIIILENEINQYKQIIKSQSNNLKENIGTIEKLSKKEELLKKALKQSHELVKE